MFTEIFSSLLRKEKISPLKLAEKIGVPKSMVYEWKSGKREPSVENLVKIADYFGVSLEYLTGRDEKNDSSETELIVMLRTARNISPEDHDALVKQFKENIGAYLESKRTGSDG